MKTQILSAWAIVALGGAAKVKTATFTCKGRLVVEGNSFTNGDCDFRFRAVNRPGGGGYVGPQVMVTGVAVNIGCFTATLDLGAGVFPGPERWLEINVRINKGAGGFKVLSPRQALNPNPYDPYANDAANASSASARSALAAGIAKG